jgi:hypothetical protein
MYRKSSKVLVKSKSTKQPNFFHSLSNNKTVSSFSRTVTNRLNTYIFIKPKNRKKVGEESYG